MTLFDVSKFDCVFALVWWKTFHRWGTPGANKEASAIFEYITDFDACQYSVSYLPANQLKSFNYAIPLDEWLKAQPERLLERVIAESQATRQEKTVWRRFLESISQVLFYAIKCLPRYPPDVINESILQLQYLFGSLENATLSLCLFELDRCNLLDVVLEALRLLNNDPHTFNSLKKAVAPFDLTSRLNLLVKGREVVF